MSEKNCDNNVSTFHDILVRFERDSTNKRRLRSRLYSGMRLTILLFFLVLSAGFIVSFILPLRPAVSETEKRELTKFPDFSFRAITSGKYFDDISTWYSDTFPGREGLITLNNSVRELYIGQRQVQIHGTVEQGDEIPELPSKPAENTQNPAPENNSKPDAAIPDGSEDTPPTGETPPPIDASGNTQSFSAVLLADNAAYEYYDFRQTEAETYVSAVSAAADELSGAADVYSVIVPTSMGITLPDNLKETTGSSDQSKAINYMYGSMSGNVKAINIFDTLISHRDEYIYFRTDHHWTALGAYYAYEQYCSAAGLTAETLSGYDTASSEGYLGSFYSSTSQSSALADDPDTITTYQPRCSNTMLMTQRDGQTIRWPLVSDADNYSAGMKYSVFIGGDNPYTIIKNNDLHDGSSIVVVKESFGNAFVPFLVDHYETVHVIDYRYWDGDLTDWVKENKVQSVLFMNNISSTRSETLMGYLKGII